MTKQNDIINDPKYVAVLDHGFVGLVDHMGSDADIVSAARVSYGDGTKSVNEDRGLIRYLVSHKHTSPIEMAEVKLHIKMPIFIARQWIRHRTASINEYSGRYSVMTDEQYLPSLDALAPQSKTNKQGRGETFEGETAESVAYLIESANGNSFEAYKTLVTPGAEVEDKRDSYLDAYCPDEEYRLLPDDYPGLSRELSRIVLPLATYTEFYWKQDLHNLLHLIKLRRDVHAQQEVRDYAEAVFKLIQPLFPLTIEAWEDYIWAGRTLSRMEIDLLQEILESFGADTRLLNWIEEAGGAKAFATERGLSLRELRAFQQTWNLAQDTSEVAIVAVTNEHKPGLFKRFTKFFS